jgi:hypothetical protein
MPESAGSIQGCIARRKPPQTFSQLTTHTKPNQHDKTFNRRLQSPKGDQVDSPGYPKIWITRQTNKTMKPIRVQPYRVSTETTACEQQLALPKVPLAARAFNQKNQDPLPLPEQPVPPKPTKRMTPWGFEVPVYQSKTNVNSDGTHCRQVTLEEFCSMQETPLAQPTVEQEVLGRPQIGPPEVPMPVPCTEGEHSNEPRLQEQRQQSTGQIETPPSSLDPAPVSVDWFPRCPAPGAGVNVWCLKAALACERHGLLREEAESLILEKISRPPRSNEIQRALNKAYAQNFPRTVQPPITCGFDEAELNALAYNAPGWSIEKLKSVSPIDVNCCTTIQFLRHVFKVGERVIIATEITDRGTIWINDPQDPTSSEDELDCFKKPPEKKGAWFLSNPVTGESVELERLVSLTNPCGDVPFRGESHQLQVPGSRERRGTAGSLAPGSGAAAATDCQHYLKRRKKPSCPSKSGRNQRGNLARNKAKNRTRPSHAGRG